MAEADAAMMGAGDAQARTRGQGGPTAPRRGTSARSMDQVSQQIMHTGETLLRGFIIDRANRGAEGCDVHLTVAELGGREDDLQNPELKKLAVCLRQIGDELDGNVELQRMIDSISSQCPKETFIKVAKEQFADGVINWGRVVTLFYFACRLVVKALCQKIPEMIQTIISWTMEYIQENILRWIRDLGGWEALLGTPTWQTVAIFCLGVFTTLAIVKWKSS
ncbi:apoptosis regulator BAX-like isoform X1 [Leucoraja erinacea]|uniref:apoptosis regulator BAX-like isoform X1 n=2 Tax=Leucoraja erinaceus TaxID=7782 RepID=UPI0024584A3A|nr:apoptosis regulator BAX-like isoform X1 [Leucoraja erinacea]